LHNATSGETFSAKAWPKVSDQLDYLGERPLDLELGDRRHPLLPCIGRGRQRGYTPPSPSRPSGDHPHHPHAPPPLPPPRGSERPSRKGDHASPCEECDSPIIAHRPVFSANVTLPTLLTNHSLHVRVAKFGHRLPIPGHKKDIYVTKLFVNDQSVVVSDVISKNGAVHVIDKVLNPRPRHHCPHKPQIDEDSLDIIPQDTNEWEDWEDWLPRWAEGN